MEQRIKALPALAKDKENAHKKFFSLLKRKPPKQLDRIMAELHEREFEKTDCLACANCCKTTGPLFTEKDIVRIAKHLRMKPQAFTEQYLRIDEDRDRVLQELPCTFLGAEIGVPFTRLGPKRVASFHTRTEKNSNRLPI